MDLIHDEFQHDRSGEYIVRGLELLEPAAKAKHIWNARYVDAKFCISRAYSDERMALRDRNGAPDHKDPRWNAWWALHDAVPYELLHLHTIQRKLAEAVKRTGADLTDPLLAETHAKILRFEARWTPILELVRETKGYVVKGREPSTSPRKTPERTLDHTGSCSCCARNIKYDDEGRIVDHGYQVAYNSRHGRCFGVGYPPFEVSAAGAEAFHEHLVDRGRRLADELVNLESGNVPAITDFSMRTPRTYAQGEEGYDRTLRSRIAETKGQIRQNAGMQSMFGRKIAAWAPAPLPDGTRDHMPADVAPGVAEDEPATPGMH